MKKSLIKLQKRKKVEKDEITSTLIDLNHEKESKESLSLLYSCLSEYKWVDFRLLLVMKDLVFLKN